MGLKSYYENVMQQARQILHTPVEEISGWRRRARYVMEFAYHCYKETLANRATQMAAALTYYTLFSMLPTLVLMLVVMHSFLGETERDQFKETAVEWVVEIIGEPPEGYGEDNQADATGAGADGDTPADAEPSGDGDDELSRGEQWEEFRNNLDKHIQAILNQLEGVSFSSIGTVGILVFIYAATSLLRSIEFSFNAIYKAFSIRSIVLRLPVYYMVITLGPIVILAGQYAQTIFLDMVESAPWTAWLSGPMAVLTPLFALWLVLWLAYMLLPSAYVNWRSAMVGALVSAILWAALIFGFKFYVGRYSYTNLYGALALLPLFLFFLWLSWLIILFGLEVTYTLQHLGGTRLNHDAEDQDKLVDPHDVLPLMAIVAEQFAHGHSIRNDHLAARMGLPNWAVQQFAKRLIDHGLLYEIQRNEEGETGLTLTKPADQISVLELLGVTDEMSISSKVRKRQRMQVIEHLDEAQRNAAEGKTLADLTVQEEKEEG